jgi:hypothetical protein
MASRMLKLKRTTLVAKLRGREPERDQHDSHDKDTQDATQPAQQHFDYRR